jgi:hypothetical protein
MEIYYDINKKNKVEGLTKDKDNFIVLHLPDSNKTIYVFGEEYVSVYGKTRVKAFDKATIEAYEDSKVTVYDDACATAFGDAEVEYATSLEDEIDALSEKIKKLEAIKAEHNFMESFLKMIKDYGVNTRIWSRNTTLGEVFDQISQKEVKFF